MKENQILSGHKSCQPHNFMSTIMTKPAGKNNKKMYEKNYL